MDLEHDEHDQQLAAGTRALARCRWDDAATAFRTVLDAAGEHAGALDGLGRARYWQRRYDEAFELRERAFALHRRAGDHRAAAMVAVRLAMWHGLIRGNGAAVSGWLAQATRCIGDDTDCREAGWVELFRACITPDPDERERRASRAVETARAVGDPDLEFDALAYVGTAHVERARLDVGLRLVDEAVAAVSSGVVSDPWAAGEIYCVLLSACELALDLPRAEQWLGAVTRYVERTGEVPIEAIGKMHYGAALTMAGRYAEAERQLRRSLAIYDETYVGTRSLPLLRLAEVLARTGRCEEAGRLVAGLEDVPDAARARACTLAADGEHDAAAVVLDRTLSPGRDRMADAPTLVLAARLALDAGDHERAVAMTDDLAGLAEQSGSPAIAGLTRMLRGAAAAATSRPDAVPLLERAIGELAAAGLHRDAARTRLVLAEVLVRPQPGVARAEARTAYTQLRRLGDEGADDAAALLARLGEPLPHVDESQPWSVRPARAPDGAGAAVAGLTPRQREVLTLVADGGTNAEIAERLVLSERTVEHHVSNILRAMGVRSRTEAAAELLRAPSGA